MKYANEKPQHSKQCRMAVAQSFANAITACFTTYWIFDITGLKNG